MGVVRSMPEVPKLHVASKSLLKQMDFAVGQKGRNLTTKPRCRKVVLKNYWKDAGAIVLRNSHARHRVEHPGNVEDRDRSRNRLRPRDVALAEDGRSTLNHADVEVVSTLAGTDL
ncbi:hypothetical protein GQ607_016484 [Colletotrichum asianum]|uniref:Uncharacterized protein n=1 Tax=Colletotrichum asianum TaxID=702518 RepID=A0A8H3VTP4_9PEZI|nr:hypothetical protein GQ607_016484 [Colletotrichum asianum]